MESAAHFLIDNAKQLGFAEIALGVDKTNVSVQHCHAFMTICMPAKVIRVPVFYGYV